MKIFFVTKAYPYPAHSGDFQFTGGIIEALAERNDVELTVYCCGGLPVAPAKNGRITWIAGHPKVDRRRDLMSLISRDPRQASRTVSRRDLRDISKRVAPGDFEVTILNESCTGSVAGVLGASRKIYLSHNVDTVIRPTIARAIKNPLKRLLQVFDASKYSGLERRLMNRVDGMTAISETDLRWYQKEMPATPSILLKPGYSGARLPARRIDASVPLVVALVGSFFWNAKQRNLFDILDAYVNRLKTANLPFFQLRVAGNMPADLIEKLRRKYTSVQFTGAFDDLSDVLKDVRIALVLERLGGGFKLKILDYVFHRVPVLAFPEAMAGTGFAPGTDFISCNSYRDAMITVAETIEDCPLLNRIQESAWHHARSDFLWSDRAADIVHLARK